MSVTATLHPLEGLALEDKYLFAFPGIEEISFIMEGNKGSLFRVVTLGGLLFSLDPSEKQIN